ncbi:hypothetical protein BDZ85DRAFT_7164 [Elsinoe ampelina]|uniref:Uncharacterized protein n=1 Tax=Elsinoe ampelina TaxID=302913 RepID=A0A6A6GQH4_9PEZI|nr:hypothetical protein BDZ85DRAFT_7164 [Elsinoe ampelina]
MYSLGFSLQAALVSWLAYMYSFGRRELFVPYPDGSAYADIPERKRKWAPVVASMVGSVATTAMGGVVVGSAQKLPIGYNAGWQQRVVWSACTLWLISLIAAMSNGHRRSKRPTPLVRAILTLLDGMSFLRGAENQIRTH